MDICKKKGVVVRDVMVVYISMVYVIHVNCSVHLML